MSAFSSSTAIATINTAICPCSGRLITVSILALSIAIYSIFYQITFWDPALLGDGIKDRLPYSSLNELERLRWNSTVQFSFPNSEEVPVVFYSPFDYDFISNIMKKRIPVVIKGSPAKKWPALSKWDVNYVSYWMPVLTVHAPKFPVVRVHQVDGTHPFATLTGLHWSHPWLEQKVYTSVFFEGKKLMYAMKSIRQIPNEMLKDFNIEPFSVSFSPPMEVNLWMGTPTVTTPAHYDMVHNFYAQVIGHKRFILFPPEDVGSMYTFSNLHPSARQSQVNFNDPSDVNTFKEFVHVHPKEVILAPGDVLYIPPFHFHYVSVVGDNISMSISTHTESHENIVRQRIFSKTEAFFKSFMKKNDAIQWNLSMRSLLLAEYFMELFESKKIALKAVNDTICQHWSFLEKDDGVIGLVEKIVKSREEFANVAQEKLKGISFKSIQLKRIYAASAEIRELFRNFHGGIWDIMISLHLEEITSLVIGPLNTDPFLRYLLERLEGSIENTT